MYNKVIAQNSILCEVRDMVAVSTVMISCTCSQKGTCCMSLARFFRVHQQLEKSTIRALGGLFKILNLSLNTQQLKHHFRTYEHMILLPLQVHRIKQNYCKSHLSFCFLAAPIKGDAKTKVTEEVKRKVNVSWGDNKKNILENKEEICFNWGQQIHIQ